MPDMQNLPHEPEEIRKLTSDEERIGKDVAMLGTKHLHIAQLLDERNRVDAEIQKEMSEAKKLSADILKRISKSKS